MPRSSCKGNILSGIFSWNWVLNKDRSLRLWTVPIVFLVVSILSFGLYANQLSFYWDDWGVAWARTFRGFQGLEDTYLITRPMRAYIDSAFMYLFGVNPFIWQIIAIFLRWLASVTLWWFLRLIWPDHVRLVFIVSLLFLIYPGFSQQAIAMTYYYFWLLQVLMFLSFGLMVLAVRRKKLFWLAMLIALLLSLLQLFSSEHFFGVELLRPVFLWIALGVTVPGIKKRFRWTILYYAPFALILFIFLYWRFFIFKFPGYQPELYTNIHIAPGQVLIHLAQTIFQTITTVSLQSWSKVFQIPMVPEGGELFLALYPWIIIVSLIGLIFYQERLPAKVPVLQAETDRKYIWQIMLIGLLAILLAGLPYYFANLPVWVKFPEDRFTLSFALGVSFLFAALFELLPAPQYRIALVSAMVALAIGLHFYTGYLYRNERDLQKTFLWQLTWRAPALRQDTLILSDDQTFPYTDDEGLTAALNWTYPPDNHTDQFFYAYTTISGRLGSGTLPSLEIDTPVQKNYLSAFFSGSTNQSVVLYYSPPSCLRILNPAYDSDFVSLLVTWDIAGTPTIQAIRFLPNYTQEAIPLSNMDMILPDQGQVFEPPAFIFGSEPKHNWCYLFEKADLARQMGDWEEAARLGDDAAVNYYYPADLSEYLVFIEAYSHMSRWQDAQTYSEKVIRWAPILRPAVCAIWQRAEQYDDISDTEQSLISSVKQENQCPTP